jgi:hypothetical protein
VTVTALIVDYYEVQQFLPLHLPMGARWLEPHRAFSTFFCWPEMPRTGKVWIHPDLAFAESFAL